MSYSIIDPGNARRVEVAWTSSGAPADPDAVFLTIMQPGETSDEWTVYEYGVDSEITKDSTGVYHADITFPTTGWAYYRWWSTGPATSLEKGIEVRDRQTAG